MASQEGLKALSSAILDDARRRGEGILRNAQERADVIIRQAQEAAAARRQAIVVEAQRDADGYKRQVVSTARLQAKSLLLTKRENIISRAFEIARDRLRSSLKQGERESILARFVSEAATSLDGGRLTVRANKSDSAFLTPAFLEAVESRLAKSGIVSDLQTGPAVDIIGGVVAERDGGRVKYDNSFEARLEREKWTLRNEVWQLLVGEIDDEGASPGEIARME
ncbi:MAG: hypothetical protein HYY30_11735 [Chloroflexi bacterium]|nr:hypothetical protein [Chloroflexota bacterium]